MLFLLDLNKDFFKKLGVLNINIGIINIIILRFVILFIIYEIVVVVNNLKWKKFIEWDYEYRVIISCYIKYFWKYI